MLNIFARARRRKEYVNPFRRDLTDSAVQQIAEVLSDCFGMVVENREVREIVDILGHFERRMTGRIAGDVDDHILNYFMRRFSVQLAVGGRFANPAQLEIGTLFGGSLLMTLAAIRDSGLPVTAVCIDPLDGYYRSANGAYSSKVDIMTGLPVTRKIVEKNVIRAGFSLSNVDIIQCYSSADEAVERAAQYEILSLWLDGDHSYEGIRADWQTYSPLVVASGFVLIDNYHDSFWPGVTEFVDGYLLPNLAGWSVACSLGRSILFRKD